MSGGFAYILEESPSCRLEVNGRFREWGVVVETRRRETTTTERASERGVRSSASGFWSRAWATRAVEVNVERSASADSRTLSDAWTRLVVAAVRSGVERCRA